MLNKKFFLTEPEASTSKNKPCRGAGLVSLRENFLSLKKVFSSQEIIHHSCDFIAAANFCSITTGAGIWSVTFAGKLMKVDLFEFVVQCHTPFKKVINVLISRRFNIVSEKISSHEILNGMLRIFTDQVGHNILLGSAKFFIRLPKLLNSFFKETGCSAFHIIRIGYWKAFPAVKTCRKSQF